MTEVNDMSARHGAYSQRIAILAHAHPSLSKGGAEIAAFTLFTGLQQLNVDSIFIAACPENEKYRVTLGSEQERLLLYRPDFYDHFYHLASPQCVTQLSDIILDENISILNIHHFFNFGLGAFRFQRTGNRLKQVITFHEFLGICHHHGQMVTKQAQILCDEASPNACNTCYPELTQQQFALRKELFLTTFESFDAYISPSNFLAERYIQWGLDTRRMFVIENGLRTKPHKHVRLRSEPDHQWVFGYFGQITPFKGVDVLLRAAALLERDVNYDGRISIRIHGNLVGQSTDFLERFKSATQLGPGAISWLGPYDNSRVNKLMSECDYVVVPSTWWENSPVVIQEAYAVGRPVICSGIGGMAEKVLDGKSGMHFRVNDHIDLVRVLRLAANERTYTTLQSGIPYPYDSEEMARRYLTVLESVENARNTAGDRDARE